MDITPHVNLLRSLRGERVDYVLLIGEGVDNSFDAGASRVDIQYDGESFQFRDDGVGISRGKLGSLFSLGDHGSLSTTQLGRFGIGIKSQAVNAGNVFYVESSSADGCFSTQVNWANLLQSGKWQIDDPVWMPVIVGGPTGTTIEISSLRSKPKITSERLINEISQRFYPAIADGKKIVFNGNPIPLLPEPAMTDMVDVSLSLSGGRNAHLRGGILVNQSPLNRVNVSYKHRVIMSQSSVGCGEYGGLNKMFARIQISGPWHLHKFKNDLTEEDERLELEECALIALKPILEKCSAASISAKLSEMTARVNDLVPERLAPRRPRHLNPDKTSGGFKRRSRPGRVDVDKSDPDGPAMGSGQSRRSKDTLIITFDGIAEEHGIGVYCPGRPNRVELAKDDHFINELLEHRDTKIASRALVAIAFAIFEQGRLERDPELPFATFGQRISGHLISDEGKGDDLMRSVSS